MPIDSSWFLLPDVKATSPVESELTSRVFAGTIGLCILCGATLVGFAILAGGLTGYPWIVAALGLLLGWAGYEATVRHMGWVQSFGGLVLSHVGIGLTLSPLTALPEISWAVGVGALLWLGLAVMTAAAWAHPITVRLFGTFLVGGIGAFVALRAMTAWASGVWPLENPTLGQALLATLGLAYVDYFWTRALRLARTPDNAVDSAASLYADVVGGTLRLMDRFAARRTRRF